MNEAFQSKTDAKELKPKAYWRGGVEQR